MKKIFLSLLTIFMVLSLSVVFVKANESTTVSLEEGVQIRTDGNNGLRWVANVTHHKEGNEYGFLFAQGDLAEVTVETTGVEKRVVEGVTEEEPIMSATMVNFPKKAATQDISVVAYVKAGESYSYSNVVVRNLSEVAVNAYEKGIATGDFVEAVYDASETTFFTGEGQLKGDYQIIVTNYETSTDGSCVGIERKGNTNKAMGTYWYRVALKYNEEVKAYQVVATYDSGVTSSSYISDYDYMIGVWESNNKTDETEIKKILNLDDPTSLFVDFDIPESTGNCNINLNFFHDVELTNCSDHLGGGDTLPKAYKSYYDFAGWYNNQELEGEAILKQGKDRTLYAKYTPTNYIISYEIGEGSWAAEYTPVNTYNYESEDIILPTAENLTIEGGKFVGWYDNSTGQGNAITKISKNSYGDLTLYAIWEMDKAVEVELTAGDLNALSLYTPTKFVSPIFSAGKFIINDVEYDVVDGALFTSLDAAFAQAVDNDVIYVFASDTTYSYTKSSSFTAEVTIVGPNAGVNPVDERYNEATISSDGSYLYNDYISFIGLKLKMTNSSTGNFTYTTSNVKHLKFINCYITQMNTLIRATSSYGKNQEFTIENCKIDNVGQFLIQGQYAVKTLNVIGNYVSSCGQVMNIGAGFIRMESTAGSPTVNVYSNYFDGNLNQSVNTLFRMNAGTMVVKYNTFKNVTQYIYGSNTNEIKFNSNLYLDSEGNILNSVPEEVTGTGVVADYSVCASESDRAARYQEFLNDAIPTYEITYELNGGTNPTEVVTSFEKYEGLLALPEPTKDNNTFLGWTLEAESTEYITSISASTNRNITLYAQWQEGEATPVVVELTEADLAVLESVSATKVVGATFTNGKYSVNETIYTFGENAFTTIAAALAVAVENDIIYVFAGKYADSLTFGVNNVSLYGPEYNLVLKHNSTYSIDVTNSAIIAGATTLSSGVNDINFRGLVLQEKVTMNGNENISFKNIVINYNGSTEGNIAIPASTTSKNLILDEVYLYGKVCARTVYIKGTLDTLTVTNCSSIDGMSGLYDMVRFSAGTEATAKGTITYSNNYLSGALEAAFMDRAPKATKYIIENNYFKNIPATIYFRSYSSVKNVEYSIKYNTFINCGDNANDWDVVAVTTSSSTVATVNYNVFIDCLTTSGSYTDYIIKIRTKAGQIDCSNNYSNNNFVDSASKTLLLNATNYSALDISSSIEIEETFEIYTVHIVNEKVYVYGLSSFTKE